MIDERCYDNYCNPLDEKDKTVIENLINLMDAIKTNRNNISEKYIFNTGGIDRISTTIQSEKNGSVNMEYDKYMEYIDITFWSHKNGFIIKKIECLTIEISKTTTEININYDLFNKLKKSILSFSHFITDVYNKKIEYIEIDKLLSVDILKEV